MWMNERDWFQGLAVIALLLVGIGFGLGSCVF
jgi:hypothetical protein